MKKFLLLLMPALIGLQLNGQYSKSISVLAAAKVSGNSMTIDWPAESFTGSFKVFKRKDQFQSWATAATLASSATSWTDTALKPGQRMEYLVQKINSSNQAVAEGYLLAGNNAAEIPSFGSVLLLIDSNYILPLSSEISRLESDLRSGGWLVYKTYAGRKETPATVKTRIKNIYNSVSPEIRSLYILGHVPVPYSGFFSSSSNFPPPDGHVEGSGNHTGAWPADLYYGDINGAYTDNGVTCTTGNDARNHNIPGDGKFDQSKVANEVVMEVGRVDLYNMSQFSKNDTLLVKNYLDRAHDWFLDKIPYVERSLIDDNFTSYSLAWTGWLTSTCMIPRDSIFGNRDYIPSQNAGNYLWSFGTGAGSYNSCSGVGVTGSFVPGTFKNIFTSLSGSFFGDWDNSNNILRAPLCAGSLCSFWGGIPTWHMYQMGSGMPIGMSARYTQNDQTQDFNLSQNSVHIALMGDPTLKIRNVPPAGKLSISSTGGKVKLSWVKASGKLDGYCVYRIDTATNNWNRVNTSIITDSFYTDNQNWLSGKYKYAVRSIRLENNPSGSWYNLGGGSVAWVNHVNGVTDLPTLNLSVYPNPGKGTLQVQCSQAVSGKAGIRVIDLGGKTVYASDIRMQDGKAGIQLPDGLSGVFVLQMNLNGQTGFSRILLFP